MELHQEENSIRVVIQDWGIGFEPADVPPDRFGLRGIRERARLLGGSATIETAPDRGTCILVKLPIIERARRPAEENLSTTEKEQRQDPP